MAAYKRAPHTPTLLLLLAVTWVSYYLKIISCKSWTGQRRIRSWYCMQGCKICGNGGHHIRKKRASKAPLEEDCDSCAPWAIPCSARMPGNILHRVDKLCGNAGFNHCHNSILLTGSCGLARSSFSKVPCAFSLILIWESYKTVTHVAKGKSGIWSMWSPLIGRPCQIWDKLSNYVCIFWTTKLL